MPRLAPILTLPRAARWLITVYSVYCTLAIIFIFKWFLGMRINPKNDRLLFFNIEIEISNVFKLIFVFIN